jgi:hypothetical protein
VPGTGAHFVTGESTGTGAHVLAAGSVAGARGSHHTLDRRTLVNE